MRAEVAQVVALAAHGNRALHALLPHAHVDLAQNSSFRYVRELSFTGRTFSFVGSSSENVARTVPEWYSALHSQGIVRLALLRRAEHAAIVALTRRGRRYVWAAEWEVTDHTAPDRRIWSVRYSVSRGPLFRRVERPQPAQAIEKLDSALHEVTVFSASQNLRTWVPWFDRAARLLRGEELEPPYHPDLLPSTGYSADARRLLNGCIGAWVFGGMGSWNDSAPDSQSDQPIFDALSKLLYDAIMDGFVAATNSFEAPR